MRSARENDDLRVYTDRVSKQYRLAYLNEKKPKQQFSHIGIDHILENGFVSEQLARLQTKQERQAFVEYIADFKMTHAEAIAERKRQKHSFMQHMDGLAEIGNDAGLVEPTPMCSPRHPNLPASSVQLNLAKAVFNKGHLLQVDATQATLHMPLPTAPLPASFEERNGPRIFFPSDRDHGLSNPKQSSGTFAPLEPALSNEDMRSAEASHQSPTTKAAPSRDRATYSCSQLPVDPQQPPRGSCERPSTAKPTADNKQEVVMIDAAVEKKSVESKPLASVAQTKQGSTKVKIKRLNSDMFDHTKKKAVIKRIEVKTKEKELEEAKTLNLPLKKLFQPIPKIKRHFDNTFSRKALADVADSVTRMLLKEDNFRPEDKFYHLMTNKLKERELKTIMDRTEHIIFTATNQVNVDVSFLQLVRIQVFPLDSTIRKREDD